MNKIADIIVGAFENRASLSHSSAEEFDMKLWLEECVNWGKQEGCTTINWDMRSTHLQF